ncbi:MAG: methyltransferase domain-containing protein [Acidobacteria bacterium]|nr:methyltransferase domain-containing protein [Acidobacteriota bacterium]
MNPPGNEYIMGRTSQEYQRLRSQARVWEPVTRRLLGRLELRAGMSCLDVGCGPGEVMRVLGEIAGPTGRVAGLDVDGNLGREALGVLQATTPCRFTFTDGNVETLEEIPGAPFDVTYARITLVHVRDPIAVLRKMYAWTKPGGYIVVQEYDNCSLTVYPEWPGMVELEKVLGGVYAKAGRDQFLGRKLPTCFDEAGIGPPDGSEVASELGPFSQYGPMCKAVYSSLLPIALKTGITSGADSEAYFREVEKALSESKYTVLFPLLVGVWKRKPA